MFSKDEYEGAINILIDRGLLNMSEKPPDEGWHSKILDIIGVPQDHPTRYMDGDKFWDGSIWRILEENPILGETISDAEESMSQEPEGMLLTEAMDAAEFEQKGPKKLSPSTASVQVGERETYFPPHELQRQLGETEEEHREYLERIGALPEQRETLAPMDVEATRERFEEPEPEPIPKLFLHPPGSRSVEDMKRLRESINLAQDTDKKEMDPGRMSPEEFRAATMPSPEELMAASQLAQNIRRKLRERGIGTVASAEQPSEER